MKKYLFIPLVMLIGSSLMGQKMEFWLDAGLKVQTGFSGLFNSNITEGNNWDFTTTTATKFGGKLGFNWNYVGISLDVMLGDINGRFQDRRTTGAPDREININTTDIYLLFRSAKNKGYFEIGPKLGLIGDVRNSDGTANLDDLYEDQNLSGVLGFGTYILGPEDGRFSGILGLRFEYGFQDIVTSEGSSAELGDGRQPVNYTGDAGTTNPIFVGLVFELNWGIGGVGQARCGERSKFIWF